jgi:ubiquinone/menaquinone biosynthesis C-methylase UbiE
MLGWLESPFIQEEYILPAISGPDSQGNWVSDIVRELDISRDGYWLSLGCGCGGQEIFCAEQGLCRQLDGYDISSESVAVAQNNARQKGLSDLHFYTGDFNTLQLPRSHYDVVVMSMSLHHVTLLNKLLPRIHRALKSDGWFLVNEYVGPSQFQFSDKQIQIINELLSLLPDRLRYDYVHDQIKHTYVRLPREHWFQADPSEAICSDQIEPALHRYFSVVLQRNYGGTLLNPLLEHTMGNFDPADGDATILRLLTYLERCLIRERVLRNNFAVFAVQRKWGPMALVSLPYRLMDKARVLLWRYSRFIHR